MTEPSATVPGSVLGSLKEQVRQSAESDTIEMRVGRLSRLWCRYRALDDDETTDLENRAKLRGRVTRGKQDSDAELEKAAMLLGRSCETLLWVSDDGTMVELHEQPDIAALLERAGATGPLRYNAETVDLLGLADDLDLAEDGRPSSVEVIIALHRWGKGHAPLLTTARLLGLWMSGVSADALEDVLQGS